jgi:hypothetical protein
MSQIINAVAFLLSLIWDLTGGMIYWVWKQS